MKDKTVIGTVCGSTCGGRVNEEDDGQGIWLIDHIHIWNRIMNLFAIALSGIGRVSGGRR
jgi:hypothetical protein